MVSLNDIPAAFRCRHRIGTPKCPCNHMRISVCVLQETCKFIRVWMSHSVMNPSEPFSFLLTKLQKPRTMLGYSLWWKTILISPPLDWFPFWWFSCGSKVSPGRWRFASDCFRSSLARFAVSALSGLPTSGTDWSLTIMGFWETWVVKGFPNTVIHSLAGLDFTVRRVRGNSNHFYLFHFPRVTVQYERLTDWNFRLRIFPFGRRKTVRSPANLNSHYLKGTTEVLRTFKQQLFFPHNNCAYPRGPLLNPYYMRP